MRRGSTHSRTHIFHEWRGNREARTQPDNDRKINDQLNAIELSRNKQKQQKLFHISFAVDPFHFSKVIFNRALRCD